MTVLVMKRKKCMKKFNSFSAKPAQYSSAKNMNMMPLLARSGDAENLLQLWSPVLAPPLIPAADLLSHLTGRVAGWGRT